MMDEHDILKVQPAWCRQPMPFKELELTPYMRKVMFWDPTPVYTLHHAVFNPYQRRQSGPFMEGVFLNVTNDDGFPLCACGCGVVLKGRRSRWASELCQKPYSDIYQILAGSTNFIGYYLKKFYGNQCAHCTAKQTFGLITYPVLAVDHIIPVKHGGGGGWLSNYQLLCEKCHRIKTNQDFGWKKSISTLPLKF